MKQVCNACWHCFFSHTHRVLLLLRCAWLFPHTQGAAVTASAAAAHQVYMAGSQGPVDNLALLDHMLSARHQLATLLGFRSYAAFKAADGTLAGACVREGKGGAARPPLVFVSERTRSQTVPCFAGSLPLQSCRVLSIATLASKLVQGCLLFLHCRHTRCCRGFPC